MEPFSIATGIVGVLAAIDQAQKCVRKLRTLRNAHAEIIQLTEDVSDFHETLLNVSRLVNNSQGSLPQICENAGEKFHPQALQTLENLGHKAAAKLEKLGALIPVLDRFHGQQHHSETPATRGRFTKLGFKEENWQWSRNRSSAAQLQQELRGIQLNILISLSVVSSSATLHALSRHESQTIVYGEQRQLILQYSNGSTSQSGADLQLSSDLLSPASPPPAYPESNGLEISCESVEKSSITSDEPHQVDPMTRKLPQITSEAHVSEEYAKSKPVAHGRPLLPSKSACQDWCSCLCHKRMSLRTNNRGSIFGSLFVSSNGMVFGTSACDQQQCRRNPRRTFKLIYRAPKWLTNTQFQLYFLSDPLYGPELTVKLPRTVDWHSPVWKHAIHGDTGAIQKLFAAGEASPYDVNPLGGSILHYATDRGYWDLCRLLIGLGATPFLVDDLGGNPTWKAWEHSLAGNLNEDDRRFVRESFEGGEYLESREFTVLHKIVLGLTRLDLVSMLEICTADINAVDAEGKTPLAWAALRADAATVQNLLQFGANPNVTDLRKRTPLHHVRSAECCELLLRYGADLEAKEEGGRTALHWACRDSVGNVGVVEALLAAGINPNIRDSQGETALMNAAFNGFEDCVIVLLDGSADATNTGVDISRCYREAQQNEHHSVVRCLQLRADDLLQKFGSSVLLYPPVEDVVDVSSDKVEVFVDAVEVLPTGDEVIIIS